MKIQNSGVFVSSHRGDVKMETLQDLGEDDDNDDDEYNNTNHTQYDHLLQEIKQNNINPTEQNDIFNPSPYEQTLESPKNP